MGYLKYCFQGFAAKGLLFVTLLVTCVFFPYWIGHSQDDVSLDIDTTIATFSFVWLVFFIGNYFAYRKYKNVG